MFLNKTQLRLCELLVFFFFYNCKDRLAIIFYNSIGINIVIYTSLFVITYYSYYFYASTVENIKILKYILCII